MRRAVLAALVVALSLSGCDIFDKKKTPLPGERIAVMQDRREIEPDKDAGSINVVLPPPAVNDSWPQSGGFANYAMQHLAVGDSPQVIWSVDVGAGSRRTPNARATLVPLARRFRPTFMSSFGNGSSTDHRRQKADRVRRTPSCGTPPSRGGCRS